MFANIFLAVSPRCRPCFLIGLCYDKGRSKSRIWRVFIFQQDGVCPMTITLLFQTLQLLEVEQKESYPIVSFRAQLVIAWLELVQRSGDLVGPDVSYSNFHSHITKMFSVISGSEIPSGLPQDFLPEIVTAGEVMFQLEIASAISFKWGKRSRRYYKKLVAFPQGVAA